MKRTLLTQCLALVLAALMLSGMLALAEPAVQEEQEIVTYDSIYSSTNPIPEIAARVRPAVVQLVTKAEYWDPTTRLSDVYDNGYASACYFRAAEDGNGGYLLTNYHVVQDADAFTAKWLDGTETELELVGYDNGTDIAVMKFEGEVPGGAEPVVLGDSDQLQIGELAIIIGNPATSDGLMFGSVSAGIISGLAREGVNVGNFSHHITTIQIDAALTGGYSGGALLNARGELVGVPVIYTPFMEGMNFCIPISQVADFVNQIIDNGNVVRPRMGVTVVSIDGPDEAMRRYPPCGAQVYNVESGTPADRAGLKEKDIITEANGERIKSSQDIVNAVDKCGKDGKIDLVVYRYQYGEDGSVTGSYERLEMTVELDIID